MKRIIFAIGILMTALSSCQETTPPPIKEMVEKSVEKLEAGFIHTVYFWMKEDLDDTKRKFFEDGLRKLEKVPSIQSVYWGPPVKSERDVVDSSFDYAWIVHFKDAAAQDAYQVDPIHVAFVEESKDLWEKVIVYDNLVER